MKYVLLSIGLVAISSSLLGQIPEAGPVINGYGAVYAIEDQELLIDSSMEFKAVFDITGIPDDPSSINPQINTLARFLNMHAQNGIPIDKMKLTAVFHSNATYSIMKNKAYSKKYGVDNPNLELLLLLKNAGVNLYVCGQSLHARNVARDSIHPSISVALSAMTVLLYYQNLGYGVIKL